MNIKTVFRTIIHKATATWISGTEILSVSNVSAATQNPSPRKRRRLARYLVTAAATTGLLAAGVVTADASVPYPWGGTVETTFYCDPGQHAVTLLTVPDTGAVAEIHLHDPVTGAYMGGASNLTATPGGGGATYGYFHGASGVYAVYYNLYWMDVNGQWYYNGEWAQAYRDVSGAPTNGCFL